MKERKESYSSDSSGDEARASALKRGPTVDHRLFVSGFVFFFLFFCFFGVCVSVSAPDPGLSSARVNS